MKKKAVLLAIGLAFILCPIACKKKEQKTKQSKQHKLVKPSNASQEESKEKKGKKEKVEFNYTPTGIYGPPEPLLSEKELEKKKNLAKWTRINPTRPHDQPAQYKTEMQAALDVETLNNRVRLVFDMIVEGEFKRLLERKFLIQRNDYENLVALHEPGLPNFSYEDFKLYLLGQAEKAQQEYLEFLKPVDRYDKLVGPYRLAAVTFKFKDKNGKEKTRTYLMVLASKWWWPLDLNFDEKLKELKKDKSKK